MMLNNIDICHFRSILCLNGHLPDRSFFSAIQLPIIAADGAANTLFNLGIIPHIVVGDLDSIHPTVREKNNVYFNPDQNYNDFTKALDYLKKEELLPTIVLGINGNHLDHILNNISIFLSTDNLFYDPPIIGYVIHNEKKRISLPFNTKLSLIGMPTATVTTRGLKWELNKKHLFFPGENSCFNRTILETIDIESHNGSILLLVYTEPTIDAGSSSVK